MKKVESIYEDLFNGEMKEAKEKFPFINEGLYLMVLKGMSKNIGIFPKESSFYVVTRDNYRSPIRVSVEETNSIKILNVIIKRETYQAQYLNGEEIEQVRKFLEDNKCTNILYPEAI